MEKNKKLKKHKAAYIFAPILGLGLIAGTVTPIALAKPNKWVDEDTTPTVELDVSSSKDVSIKSSSLKLNTDSTINLDIKQTEEEKRQIGKVEIKIDGVALSSDDFTIDQKNNKITINAKAMKGINIVINITTQKYIDFMFNDQIEEKHIDKNSVTSSLFRSGKSYVNFNVDDNYEVLKIGGSIITTTEEFSIDDTMYQKSNKGNLYTITFNEDLLADAEKVNLYVATNKILNATLNDEATVLGFTLTSDFKKGDISTITINVPEGFEESISKVTLTYNEQPFDNFEIENNIISIPAGALDQGGDIIVNIEFGEGELEVDLGNTLKSCGVSIISEKTELHRDKDSIITLNIEDEASEIIKDSIDVTLDGASVKFTLKNNQITIPNGQLTTGANIVIDGQTIKKLNVDVPVGANWTVSRSRFSRDSETPSHIEIAPIDGYTIDSVNNVYLDNNKLNFYYDSTNQRIEITAGQLSTGSNITLDITTSEIQYSLKLNENNIVLDKSVGYKLEATLTPEPLAYTIEWSSSDNAIASVDNEGNVTGVESGNAIITATCTLPSDNKISATCNIAVKDPETQVAVTFHTNKPNNEVYTEIITKNTQISEPTTPEREDGAVFDGWYTEADLINKFNFDKAIENDFDLYAKWNNTFNSISWTNVIEAIDAYENIEEPTVTDAVVLCKSLGVKNPIVGDSIKETLQNNLVAKTGSFTINNQMHEVKCIDAMHDEITDGEEHAGKFTVLTLEVQNVLSDSNGDFLMSTWTTASECNYDYLNSQLRKNLTGGGDKDSVKWLDKNKSEVSDTRTVLQMLPENISSSIKKVNKRIGINESKTPGGNNYSLTWYQDKIFCLTHYELNYTNEQMSSYLKEGSPYKYYETYSGQEYRKKVDCNKNKAYYHISSPFILSSYATDHYIVKDDGEILPQYYSATSVECPMTLSFAFCI